MSWNIATLEGAARTFRADMWDNVPEDAVSECGIVSCRFGPIQAMLIEALPDAPGLNTVLGASEVGTVEDDYLQEAIEWVDSFDVDYRVLIARGRPGEGEAEAWLAANGFEQGRGLVRYVRDGSLPDLEPVAGVKVWEIGPGDADGAVETMVLSAAPAMGLPAEASTLLCDLPLQDRWRTYTAELDGDIVAYGSMLIHGRVAALGLEATDESARRRGCNLALLRQRLIDASEAGCDTVFAGVPSYGDKGLAPGTRNLIRAGFVPTHHCMNWQRLR